MARGWTRWILKIPSNANHSVSLQTVLPCAVLIVHQPFVSPSAVAVVLLFPVCKCNPAGVLPATCPGGDAACLCDPATGACPCQPNVVGTTCDQCAPGYWDLAGGKGCQLCDCDVKNTQSNQCDQARKLLCSLGTGRAIFWHDTVGTFSYGDGFLSCFPETTSLWKLAVGGIWLGAIILHVLF